MEFQQFSQSDFDDYLPTALAHLGQEISKAKNIEGLLGLELAKKSFDSLFPGARVSTTDQFIGWLVENDARVGVMHFGIIRETGSPCVYLWDFEIFPEHRKKGLGKSAMQWLEEETHSLGLHKIRLNVFGHNHEAKRLYDNLGFQSTSITMIKTL